MTSFKKEITVNTSRQEVWEIVSNLGDIYKFHPGVSKSYYETDKKSGIGAARVCELLPSGKILETVRSWDEGSSFKLQIDPIEKAPPVKEFTGYFQLEEVNANHTKVSLTINYKMKLGLIGNMLNKLVIKSKMEEGIEDLLQGLKVHIENGMDIKDIKTLRNILSAA